MELQGTELQTAADLMNTMMQQWIAFRDKRNETSAAKRAEEGVAPRPPREMMPLSASEADVSVDEKIRGKSSWPRGLRPIRSKISTDGLSEWAHRRGVA